MISYPVESKLDPPVPVTLSLLDILMRSIVTSFIILASLGSCERRKDVVTEVSFPTIHRCSAFAARKETGACYEIVFTSNPPKILWAYFGDGTQELKSANGKGECIVHDFHRNEDWTLKIEQGGQLFIHPDRTVERLENFATIIDGKVAFNDASHPILTRVKKTYHDRHKSE